MKKKFNSDIILIIGVLIIIALIFLLGEGTQIVGQAAGIGDFCDTDDDCDSGFCNENHLCIELEPPLPISERIATITIS